MIKLNSCRKCGGKGILVSFDCTYNVKYKSLNFLKNGMDLIYGQSVKIVKDLLKNQKSHLM